MEEVEQTSTQTKLGLQVDRTCLKPRVVVSNDITVPQHRHGLGLVEALGVGVPTRFRAFGVT